MGYYFAMGRCVGCRRAFSFNPALVPSVRLTSMPEATREPLCSDCVARMQARQRAAGVAVWPDPVPGAYDVAEGMPPADNEP